MDSVIFYTLAGIVGLIVLIFVIEMMRSFIVVEGGTAVIVERLGEFHGALEPGLHLLVPFIDRCRKFKWRFAETYLDGSRVKVHTVETTSNRIDLRETVLDLGQQPVITRDNVKIHVHPMLLFRIVDPVRAVYETCDLHQAAEKLVHTTMRAIIGDMGLDDTLASREEINRALNLKIARTLRNWGIHLVKVELLEIKASNKIVRAMHQQLAAERDRRANIIISEGKRGAVRTEAEGDSQSEVTVSQAEAERTRLSGEAIAEAKKIFAGAEAESIRMLAPQLEGTGVDSTSYLLSWKYVEALREIARQASKVDVVLPLTTEVDGILPSL